MRVDVRRAFVHSIAVVVCVREKGSDQTADKPGTRVRSSTRSVLVLRHPGCQKSGEVTPMKELTREPGNGRSRSASTTWLTLSLARLRDSIVDYALSRINVLMIT